MNESGRNLTPLNGTSYRAAVFKPHSRYLQRLLHARRAHGSSPFLLSGTSAASFLNEDFGHSYAPYVMPWRTRVQLA